MIQSKLFVRSCIILRRILVCYAGSKQRIEYMGAARNCLNYLNCSPRAKTVSVPPTIKLESRWW